MATVAEILHAEREAQNLTVYQVADATKIKTDHIRALEEGNFDVFSAPVFLRGFIRTYARYLRLDVDAIMNQLEQETSVSRKLSEPPPLMGEPNGVIDWITLKLSRLNWAVVLPLLAIVIIALAAVFGYRAWRTHQSKDPLSDLGPGLYQADPGNGGRTLPVPGNE